MSRPKRYIGCKVDNCDKKHKGKGYCVNHYYKFMTTGSAYTVKKERKCKLDGCDKKHEAKGYCKNHYMRFVTKYAIPKFFCTIDGCKGIYKAKGFCKKHYQKDFRKKNGYYLEKSWVRTYRGIKARCNGETQEYYKKGRKCLITKEELKILWFRDKAYLMKKPSIDRVKNDGHYKFKNCRYIESSLNAMLGNVGENSPRHKLTWKIVKEIRNKYIPYKVSFSMLGKEYNVSSSVISNIIANKAWVCKHRS